MPAIPLTEAAPAEATDDDRHVLRPGGRTIAGEPPTNHQIEASRVTSIDLKVAVPPRA